MAATLALLAFALAAPPPTAPAPRAAGTDGDGFPLPPGAVARLGSGRFRATAPVRYLTYSPDGTRLAGAGGDAVWVWDADTGRRLFRAAEPGTFVVGLSFAAGGRTLLVARHRGETAVVSADAANTTGKRPGAPGSPERVIELATYDAAAGTPLRAVELAVIQDETPPTWVAFAPDGGRVVVFGPADGGQVAVWDSAAGRVLWAAHCPSPSAAAFSPDGRRLAVHGDAGPPMAVRTAVYAAATGRVEATWRTSKVVAAAAAFTPDGRWLLVGRGVGHVHLRDTVRNVDQAVRPAVFRWLGFPPGSDKPEPDEKPAVVPAGALSTPVPREPAPAGPPTWMARRADGTQAAGVRDADPQTVRVWDPRRGGPVPAAGPADEVPARLAWLDGGRTVAGLVPAHGETRWVAWNAGRPAAAPVPLGSYAGGLVSPAGLGPRQVGKGWVLADVRTGRPVRELETGGVPNVTWDAFSADGRRAFGQSLEAALGGGDDLVVVDVATGRRVARYGSVVGQSVRPLSVSAKGDAVAVYCPGGGDAALGVWEPDTGRRRFAVPFNHPTALTAALTPDGGTLVHPASVESVRVPDGKPYPVVVRDAHTGGERLRFDGPPAQPWPQSNPGGPAECALVPSPDSRGVLVGWADGSLELRELATGGVRTRFRHDGPVKAAAFTPDGRLLAASSRDAGVLLWDVYGVMAADAPTPPAAALRAAWADLGSPDAGVGFRAVRTLAAGGADGLAVIGANVAAFDRPPAAALRRLVDDLDAADHPTRERASAELAAVRWRAQAYLVAARPGAPPEAGRRLDALLARPVRADPDGLRLLRAVEAAEAVGTPAALAALDAWAKGDGLLAAEAKAAAERLKARTP